MRAGLLRAMRPEEITCPAGQLRGDASCACGIEDTIIDGQANPESIEAFCAGDYKECPSWRAEKDARAAGQTTHTIIEQARRDGARARARKEEHKADRFERARHLLFGNSEESRRFRARSGIAAKVGAKGMAEIERRAA